MHCAPCTQEKTFRVVENRCLQCGESIFLNLPQFVKAGVKESLNRFSWYFSLHLLDILVWYRAVLFLSVCFTAELLMAVPSKRTVGRPLQRGESILFIVYCLLFCLPKNYTNQMKSNYLNSHGEEAQEKQPGL